MQLSLCPSLVHDAWMIPAPLGSSCPFGSLALPGKTLALSTLLRMSLYPSQNKNVKLGVTKGEEGTGELMEKLEQVHQFQYGVSPKEGSSSLLNSHGCGKDQAESLESHGTEGTEVV